MDITIEQDSESDWYIATVEGNEFSFATQGETKIEAVLMAADGLRYYVDNDWSDTNVIMSAIHIFHTQISTSN